LGDHEAAVIWHTSDRLRLHRLPDHRRRLGDGQHLADQLNDLDAAADAEQAAALIDTPRPSPSRSRPTPRPT
jgi:hypothetical protein